MRHENQIRRRMKGRVGSWRTAFLAHVVLLLALLSGCTTPVGIQYMSSREAYHKLSQNVLSAGVLSATTTQILKRSGRAAAFDTQPAEVIAFLHKGLPTIAESERLFALAELSFLHATRSSDQSYFLSAALYAYAFLFPEDPTAFLDPFDPRCRTAVDIYNQGLAAAFSKPKVYPLVEASEVVLEAGTYPLPFGQFTVTVNPDEFVWGTFRFVNFVQASQLEVRGLRNRYRWPGFGAALVASLEELPGARDTRFARVPPGLKVSVTAVLRVDRIHEALKSHSVSAKLELYTVSETTTVTVDGRTMPLEFEPSAALATTLEGSAVYDTETKGFFLGDFRLMIAQRFQDGVFLMAPYRPGRIPVVLVHGTASSPARWAELVNEIQNDRDLWGRYQVWLFTYNTGNPILYSSGILTDGLRNIVRELDPKGKDGALNKMIVIGHSQGGLLTKLTVVNSGTAFWDNGFDVPIDQVDVSPETKKLLQRSLFYTPLPFVKRVIFVATPHRGSFVAGGFIGKTAGTFIKLPFTLLSPIQEVLLSTMGPGGETKFSVKNIPKSTDNMNPKSPFIKTLSSLPIAPTVTAYSIIPVKNSDAPKEMWNDGVVEYSSAHIEGVKTELIVDSDHSTQGEPATIEEIRRILLENLKEP
jgi:pimeloyl-ACP methyl ester carboxylesterase